jgi:toxin ParE1/3/4
LKHRLTNQAERDVSNILTQTYRLFGEHQFSRYVGILNKGVAMIADEPFRPSSKDPGDIRKGIRSFHLQLAAGRIGGPSHVIYYLPSAVSDYGELIVVRILSDEMEPKRRVVSALRADRGGDPS